jgi:hypothetical protein
MASPCIGFHVGEGDVHEPLDIAGFWAHAKGEINAWIAKDMDFEADGLSGDLNNLVGMKRWTATAADCLDIKDMELEDAGSDCDFDSDSADRAE